MGVLLEELDWKRPSLPAGKRLVQMVQQVVGEGFWRAGVGRPGDVGVEQADACRGPRLDRFVLPVDAAVGMHLEQTFDQQDGVGVPVGEGGEIRPFAKIRHVVKRRVQKGRHRYRAGKVAELVAVYINPEGVAVVLGRWREENVRLVQVPHHDLQLVQAAERLVQPLKQGHDLAGTQGVLLPKIGLAQPFEWLGVGGQFGHLQADELARFVVDGGAGGQNIGRQRPFLGKPVVQFGLMSGCGLVVQFYGRIAQPKHHPLTAGLDEVGGVELVALVLDVDCVGHVCFV